MIPLDAELQKTKIRLLRKAAFFAMANMTMPIHWDESVPTACTNGEVMRINPQYYEKLSPEERVGLHAHELCHAILDHCGRTHTGWDLEQANEAADYAVNWLLKEFGFHLPQGGLYDDKYANMSFEEIYNSMPKKQQGGGGLGGLRGGGGKQGKDGQNGQQPIPDPGGMGTFTPNKQQPPHKAIEKLAQAYHAAKMAGELPGDVERMLGDMLEPKVEWRAHLQDFLTNVYGSQDYTWRKANRRYLQHCFILPSLADELGGHLAIFVDTSGSINEQQLQEFAAEIDGVRREFKISADVVYCDTRIQGEEHYDSDQPLDLHPKGGGGTRCKPLFDWAKDKHAEAIIYFTYGEIGDIECAVPEHPLLWVITDNKMFDNPHGRVIRL